MAVAVKLGPDTGAVAYNWFRSWGLAAFACLARGTRPGLYPPQDLQHGRKAFD